MFVRPTVLNDDISFVLVAEIAQASTKGFNAFGQTVGSV
jgi:hypothetical protein